MKADLEGAFAELSRLYERIDAAVAAGDCRLCGRCCCFESFGHRLYATRLEVIYLVAKCGPPPHGFTRGQCPYQSDTECLARSGRVLGCRTFFCSLAGGGESELHEQALAQIGEISHRHNLPRDYRPIEEHFRNLTQHPGS
jgi:Fe-S-cluster containining protein